MGELPTNPERARRQARVAGWALVLVVVAMFIGVVASGLEGTQGDWILQGMFFFFGLLVAIPAAIIWGVLDRRASRIEDETSS